MDLGVRIELTCPLIHLEVNHALDFWSTVIDMEWHDVQNSSCAIAIFDAPDDLVQDGIVGRSHLPEWGNFSGWIVLDPKMPITMSAKEIYSTAVHELGHMFGIHHSGDIKSVMYPFNCDGTEKLQPADLVEVAMRHKLRSNVFRPIKIRN